MVSKITAKDCLHLANDIIVNRNLLIPRLTALKDINYRFYVLILEDLFGPDFAHFSQTIPNSLKQEIQLMTQLLTFVSNDLFSINLDHISAQDLVDHKVLPIHDFLEIMATFVKLLPKEFKENNAFPSKPAIKLIGSSKMSTEDLLRSLGDRKSESLSSSSCSRQSTTSSESNGLFRSPKRSLRRQSKSSLDYNRSNRKQDLSKQSIAVQTEADIPAVTSKSISVSPIAPKLTKSIGLQTRSMSSPKLETNFDEYKRLKCENFATLLGHRLHETLRLKELTDSIEYRIKRYYGDVTTQSPQRPKSTVKCKSGRKASFLSKRSPQTKQPLKTPLKCKTNLRHSFRASSLDDLIKAFPSIPRHTIKSLHNHERQQKKVIENLNKDIAVNERKEKCRISAAIDTQHKRSQLIREEIKHLEVLADTKASKMAKIKDNAEKRDERIERSRMHKMMDKFQTDLNAKYKRLQAKEERIVLNEYEEKEKRRKDYINDLRLKIKEKHSSEIQKQRQLLDAFETLYQNKYEELNQSLNEEERRLKSEISSQSHYLRSLKREFNERFENDLKTVFKS